MPFVADFTLRDLEAVLDKHLGPVETLHTEYIPHDGGLSNQTGHTEVVHIPPGYGNSAVLEVFPSGAGASVSFQVQSGSAAGALTNVGDSAGLQTAITGPTQILLTSLLPYVGINVTALTGKVQFRITFHSGTRPATASDTAGVVQQGARSASAQVWLTQQEDGAGNTQPAMDVAARAGFVEITDGVNTMAMDGHGSAHALLYASDGSVLLPAAAALSDSMATPTTTQVGADLMGFDGSTWDRLTAGKQQNFDGNSLANFQLAVSSFTFGFNGSTWDRQYNNTQGTLLASAARTTTAVSANQTNFSGRVLIVTLNVTAASGTGGLSVEIRNIDPISGSPTAILKATAAITATGIVSYAVGPGVTGTQAATSSAGGTVQSSDLPLGRTWSVAVSVGDASSYTYSLSFQEGN